MLLPDGRGVELIDWLDVIYSVQMIQQTIGVSFVFVPLVWRRIVSSEMARAMVKQLTRPGMQGSGKDYNSCCDGVVVVVCCSSGASQKQPFQAFERDAATSRIRIVGGNMVYCMADGIQQRAAYNWQITTADQSLDWWTADQSRDVTTPKQSLHVSLV